jgi:hypothetical protein
LNPTSKDIATLLEQEPSLGLVFATNLFVGKEPPIPDDCVTIFDIPGDAPLLVLQGKGGIYYYFPSVQVRVRNSNYLTGWGLINKIRGCLHGLGGIVLGGAGYDLIKGVDEPFLLDYDEQSRARFVATFNIQRRE